ncbi:hypothetical protein BCR43DRAFT_13249 [Syncephalastrum racemosum]|uniref:BTB domain-containing protein n=1 Tax=Syncephalastrum racemosum TaxID=13706 RepID=A0A1X2HSP3_SYNRA|nr:hypothetical protein BCR43DRAFT_13249 [Syncephalastrum racemosum]
MLYKGHPDNPEMLSLFVKMHETTPGCLRGVRKKIQLTLKVHNTNPTNYYNDFGVGKRLHPMWLSEKHTEWGEPALATLSSLEPFLNQNQASLSINMIILKSEVDPLPPIAAPGLSPFASYFNSPEFADVQLQVTPSFEDDKEDDVPSAPDEVRNAISQDNPIFYGHKNILSAMSPMFRALFTSGMRESYESVITIQGVDAAVFTRLLRYCYTFDIQLHSVRDAYGILEAADRFQITAVREEALRYMRQEITHDNVWEIWSWADKFDCEKTRQACLEYVGRYLQELVKHPSWLHAQPKVIKAAFQIEEGVMPSEETLYDAIMAWAKFIPVKQFEPDDKSNSPPRDDSKVSIHAIQGDTSSYDPAYEVVEATSPSSESVNAETSTTACFIEDRKEGLAEILQYIRFPLMDPAYLANNVEKDPHVMGLPGVRDLLFEAYRHHAVGKTMDGGSFRCYPRRHISEEY